MAPDRYEDRHVDTVQVSVVICMCIDFDIEAAADVIENMQSRKSR